MSKSYEIVSLHRGPEASQMFKDKGFKGVKITTTDMEISFGVILREDKRHLRVAHACITRIHGKERPAYRVVDIDKRKIRERHGLT